MALETEITNLVTATNNLTTEVIGKQGAIDTALNDALSTIDATMDAKIEGIASVYVDSVVGLDTNTGNAVAPFKTITHAIESASKYNKKLRVYLQSGQDHIFDRVLYSYCDEVRFIPWNGGVDTPFSMNSNGSTRAQIKAAWPSIISSATATDINQNGGLLSDTAMKTAYWFYNLVIETAIIPAGAESSIWNGFFFRRGVYDSDKTIMAATCLFVLNSPFIHLTAGTGLLNFSSYYNVFDVSGLLSANPVSDRLIVNEGGKPVNLHMIGSVAIGLPVGQVFESKILSDRRYSSAVAEESPYNITSNLNLSRAVAPII